MVPVRSFIILALALLWLHPTAYSQEQSEIDKMLDEAWFGYSENPRRSLEILDDVIAIAKKDNNRDDQLTALEMKGIVYEELGFMNKASDIYLNLLKERESKGEFDELISLYLNLGSINIELQNTDAAKEYLDKAAELSTEYNELIGELYAKGSLATIYSKTGDTDTAIAIFQEQIPIYDSLGHGLSINLSNIGLAYERGNQLDSALLYYQRAFEELSPDDLHSKAMIINNKAGIYHKLKRIPEAKEQALLSLNLSDSLGIIDLSHKNYELLAQLEFDLYNYQQASEYYKKTVALQDSLSEIADSKYLTTLSTVYEVDKKEKEIANLDEDKKQQQETIGRLILVSSIVVLALILTFVWFRFRLITRKREQEITELQLAQQNTELEKYRDQLQLRTKNLLEKNRLVKEIQKELKESQQSADTAQLQEVLTSKILTNQDWDNYKKAFEHVHPQFFNKLKAKSEDLTQGEQRTAALMKLDLSNLEIAEILGISDKSVIQNKYRLRKKLNLEDNSHLSKLLMEM
ncbi:MAG: tetratricopeptide repeat protein [Bacteroidota bacterium]